jgi:putative hemolysin
MKHLTRSLCLLGLLLLVGAGCGPGAQENTSESQTTTSTATAVRKPPAVDPSVAALDYCESQGYSIIFTFDEVAKTNRMFCAFTKTAGCEAIDYYRGSCVPSTSVAIDVGPEGLENIRTCDRTELPVCGEDGNTYINQCIANLQQIRILHSGACTAEETANASQQQTTIQQPQGTPSIEDIQKGTYTQESTLWVNTLANLLSQKEGSRIEKCTFGDDALYYQQEGCPDCFSTLYNSGGDIICFPHNDLAGTCPAYFNKNARTSCTLIWEH